MRVKIRRDDGGTGPIYRAGGWLIENNPIIMSGAFIFVAHGMIGGKYVRKGFHKLREAKAWCNENPDDRGKEQKGK
jgi:hypothetical protein